MNLKDLMQTEYVKARYELDTVQVYAPVAEGEATVVVGIQHDADLVIYIASGKSEGAALVNMSTLICDNTDSPDVAEHIVSYYEELPKYANTDSDELFKFADQMVEKFIVGEEIKEHQYNQLECIIEDIRLAEKESYVVVRGTHAINKRLDAKYDPMAAGESDETCFICDAPIPADRSVCDACMKSLNDNKRR